MYINYIVFVDFQLLQHFVKGFYLIFVTIYNNFRICCEHIKMAAPRPCYLDPSGQSFVLFPSYKAGFISFTLISLNWMLDWNTWMLFHVVPKLWDVIHLCEGKLFTCFTPESPWRETIHNRRIHKHSHNHVKLAEMASRAQELVKIIDWRHTVNGWSQSALQYAWYVCALLHSLLSNN
jgi:hypothetical protein